MKEGGGAERGTVSLGSSVHVAAVATGGTSTSCSTFYQFVLLFLLSSVNFHFKVQFHRRKVRWGAFRMSRVGKQGAGEGLPTGMEIRIGLGQLLSRSSSSLAGARQMIW